jgi:imidazolonepropionase-like amidohydrolase
MKMRRLVAAFVLSVVWPVIPASAAGDGPAHALVDVRIVTSPGNVIESGTVVLRDGIIEAVGADVEPPADARIWKRENLTVYPGLIETYAPVEWPEPQGDDDKKKAANQSGHTNRLVHPERDMTLHAQDAPLFKKLRGAGFTTAVVVPKGGLFRGTSALINLGEGLTGSNLLAGDLAQIVSIQPGPGTDRGYPGSLMGAVALTRQTLLDARWYRDAWAAYESDPRQARPDFNTALDALAPAAHGEQRVVFETDDVLDTLRVAGIVAEFGLDAWLVGNGEEYKLLDAVAATGLPVLLPVSFPEAPEVGEEDEDDLTVTLEELRHWEAAPENPAKLAAKGVRFAFTTSGLDNAKDLHARVATAVERGLDADAALAALTTAPAAMLGFGERLGTVETGKIANLTVIEGQELFDEKVKLREVWIDGQRYELKDTKPPEVDPAGTWDMVVEAGDQKIPTKLILEGDMNNVSGYLEVMGQRVEFSSIEVSGKKVEFVFSGASLGMPGDLSFTLEIKGDSASGPGNSPAGPFTIKGRRVSGPSGEPEVRR